MKTDMKNETQADRYKYSLRANFAEPALRARGRRVCTCIRKAHMMAISPVDTCTFSLDSKT